MNGDVLTEGVANEGVANEGAVSTGWWRRNRWGLFALAPVLAAALALPVHDAYARYWNTAPREPISAGSDGWVSFAGARVQLESLTPQATFTDDFGTAVKIPADLALWRAVITFSDAGSDVLGGCDLTMSASDGATYAANAPELTDLGITAGYGSCSPNVTTGKAPDHWTSTVYFVAPKTVHPNGIRVTLRTQLPRYAWLTPR